MFYVDKFLRESILTLLAARFEADNASSHRDASSVQQIDLLDLNLDAEDEKETEDSLQEYEDNEAAADIYFERKKRISCFAHNLMLAVRSVSTLSRLNRHCQKILK